MNSVEKEPVEVPLQNGVANHGEAPKFALSNQNSVSALSATPLEVPLDLSGVVKMGRELRDAARELQSKNALSVDQATLLQVCLK